VALLVLCAILASAIFLMRVLWEWGKPLRAELEIDPSRQIEYLWPSHTQHFPQLKQSLAAVKGRDARARASRQTKQEWREWRGGFWQGFMSGLAEDFARLGQVVQILEEVSPLTPLQRTGMDFSRMQFRMNYRLAEFLIARRGIDPMKRICRLTEILGNMSAQVETSVLPSHLGNDPKKQA